VVTAPARRVLVRSMTERGLSERRALAVIGMSPSALRYRPTPDRNVELRATIVALAHRHRRYGAGMIYLKLRQAGERVNHKRVERIYVAERLPLRRRRRKKVPVADRQPLLKPATPNVVWSADFVFDRSADGRVLKCRTIVDDASTEAVAIVPAHALGGLPVTRILDRLALDHGLPQFLRTDNGLEFFGRAMLTWAHDRGVTLRLIEPGKPNECAVGGGDVPTPAAADQSGVGRSTESMTSTSTTPRARSSFRPNCSRRAVTNDGRLGLAELGSGRSGPKKTL
jgi:putative transposase